ncbi:MAG: hypothetical protein DYH13_04170 [Alphaproteobacteria bacterium PRO2]|nr:hypothetical protein [Alphaproteobacteria bacterium PRO2]
MKIQKFNKINARTFKNFPWPAGLGEFSGFNLIYGWNGSGKTTLSDIMRMIEKRLSIGEDGIIDFSFVLDGRTITNATIATDQSPPSIRVFNRAFIDKNVFADGGATPIFFIGEENIDKQKDLDAKKEALIELGKKATENEKARDEKDKELTGLCQSKATEVRGWLGITSQNSYHKGHFAQDCDALVAEGSSDQHLKGEEEIGNLRTVISGTVQPKIDISSLKFPDLKSAANAVTELLKKTVVSQTIEALTKDARLADWVKEGVEIHKDHKADQCQFCEQNLPAQRLKHLEGHFNDEYIVLDKAVKAKAEELGQIINQLKAFQKPGAGQFYSDLTERYQEACKKFDAQLEGNIQFLSALLAAVEAKKAKPFEAMDINLDIPASGSMQSLNEVVEEHNQRTENFSQAISSAKQALKYAKAAESLEGYKAMKADLERYGQAAKEFEVSIDAATKEINKIEQEIIEHKKPAEDINKDLNNYLGHSELRFETRADSAGYNIMRGTEPARALSEGEKTAIALLHFLKTLEDRSFDIKNGIVVIDDPVCSMDDTSLFYAFSFIKERTKEARQLFILTHNFSFFRQVKNWFSYVQERKKKIGKDAAFFQTVCLMENGKRISRLQPLDPLLLDYESEYQYLFSLTYQASTQSAGGGLEQFYHLPNVARRLLEAFLAFRMPGTSDGLYHKLEKVNFDKAKKTRILRFLQTNSHEDQVMQPEHDSTVLAETPQILTDVMKLIESEDKKHFDEMIKLVVPPTSQTATGTGGP